MVGPASGCLLPLLLVKARWAGHGMLGCGLIHSQSAAEWYSRFGEWMAGLAGWLVGWLLRRTDRPSIGENLYMGGRKLVRLREFICLGDKTRC